MTVVLQGYPEILDAYVQNFQEKSKKIWQEQPSETFIGEREIKEGGRITGFHSLYAGETMESIQQEATKQERKTRKTSFWKRLFKRG